jgi:tRNA1Val (adenine37-N6)-methyltransferase
MPSSIFAFKYFNVSQEKSALKVGADAMILGALVDTSNSRDALDIGAGTGVLSLMLAQQNENLFVDAVEIDKDNVADCQVNFSNSPWSKRLRLIHTDVTAFVPSAQYDLIISNPPFYSNSLPNTDLRMARAKHEAFLPITTLIGWMAKNVKSDGSCWLIWPFDTLETLTSVLHENQFNLYSKYTIYSKPNRPSRVVVQFGLSPKKINLKELTLRDEVGEYTSAYIELTKNFHAVDLSRKNGKS